MANRPNRELFEADSAAFLVKAIKDYVAKSPANRFETFDSGRIFDEPLVGFANGNDVIFQDYKEIIGDFHLTPWEVLAKHLESKGGSQELPVVSVNSFILPITYETRLSLRQETMIPSLRWNHTRWHGQDFINELSRYVVSLLESLDYRAVAPELADFFKLKNLSSGYASNWSQRHVAYAAGLGTFSLNDGFITSRGMAMRCGSVVTDAKIQPTPRAYKDYLDNCLFYREGSCMRCAERCPAGAISEQGHDKNRCLEFLFTRQKEIVKELGREEGYIGRYLGCGLCQTKVPCEARIPPKKRGKRQ
ncbi:MAG: epoxyqueuosine reductase [Dehalococcoidia bacterium]|nr:epoxyqueuosine reductase [Dehalococcoidia bacterium]